jgi:hypothetical protein
VFIEWSQCWKGGHEIWRGRVLEKGREMLPLFNMVRMSWGLWEVFEA